MAHKFTIESTTRGLTTTIDRGDYTLAVSRLSEVTPGDRQQAVIRRLKATLPSSQWRTMVIYCRRANLSVPGEPS